MIALTSLRSVAGIALVSVLAGCSSLDFFGEEETRLSGERIPVRQATTARNDVTVGSFVVDIPAAKANADWPQFNGNAAHNIGHIAAGGLQQAWSVSVGTGSGGRIVSPPVIAGGRVYTLDAASTVSAHDASSGARIWSVNLTPEGENSIDGFGGGLAVANGKIYVSSGFGRLFALDPSNGASVWDVSVRSPSRAAPVVAGGRVFVVTRENRLFAFNAETGGDGWDQRGLEQTAGILGGAGPVATDEVVIAPYSSGELTAYISGTGRPIWEEDLTGARGSGGLAALNDVSGDPVISGDTVFAASQSGRLAAIGLRDGDRLWTRNFGGAQAPYIAGNAVFFVTDSGQLMALDRATGDTAWTMELGAFEDPEDREDVIVWAGPVLAGGRLLLTSTTGRLVAVDPLKGGIVAETGLPDSTSTPPVVAGGTIYVLTDDADLVAYR